MAEVADALIALLHDDSAEVRAIAIHSLRHAKGESTIGPLIDRLDDPAPNVRRAAASVLGLMRAREAVEPLRRLLGGVGAGSGDRSGDVRRAAAGALGRIGGPRAVDVLITAMSGNAPYTDDALRIAAASALGDLGTATDERRTPRITDEITDALESFLYANANSMRPNVLQAVEEALAQIRSGPKPP